MSIEKINLCDETFNHILAIIAAQGYEPGSKIPSESELVISIGVSRNTVRTALNRLNALGILDIRHGEGYFLKDINVDVFSNLQLPILLEAHSDLETLTEFRLGVEPQGAALAAVRVIPEDLDGMAQILALSAGSLEDEERFARSDMDFHLAIAKASRNSIIHRSVEMLKALYTVWLRGFVRVHGNAASNDFHHRIFRSIRDGDAGAARLAMTEHLTDVLGKVRLDAAGGPGMPASVLLAGSGEGASPAGGRTR
ncbi:MAG: FadR family transcriptional regulator [Desulfovibrio sp.]|jgi:GntR family transcriptional repressor for pyruvate dehydrogenase complex|nr:FadR family transcriptional regulator [Desulfovibrio sp.]